MSSPASADSSYFEDETNFDAEALTDAQRRMPMHDDDYGTDAPDADADIDDPRSMGDDAPHIDLDSTEQDGAPADKLGTASTVTAAAAETAEEALEEVP